MNQAKQSFINLTNQYNISIIDNNNNPFVPIENKLIQPPPTKSIVKPIKIIKKRV